MTKIHLQAIKPFLARVATLSAMFVIGVGTTLPASASGPYSLTSLPILNTEIVGQFPNWSGPNCWNGVLVAKGYVKSLRFSSPAEFTTFLTKSCTPVETPQYGDVGRIKRGAQEVHGFIYLDAHWVLQKMSDDSFSRSAVAVQPWETMKYYLAGSELVYYRCPILTLSPENSATPVFQDKIDLFEAELSGILYDDRASIHFGITPESANAVYFAQKIQDLTAILNDIEQVKIQNSMPEKTRNQIASLIYQVGRVKLKLDYLRDLKPLRAPVREINARLRALLLRR